MGPGPPAWRRVLSSSRPCRQVCSALGPTRPRDSPLHQHSPVDARSRSETPAHSTVLHLKVSGATLCQARLGRLRLPAIQGAGGRRPAGACQGPRGPWETRHCSDTPGSWAQGGCPVCLAGRQLLAAPGPPEGQPCPRSGGLCQPAQTVPTVHRLFLDTVFSCVFPPRLQEKRRWSGGPTPPSEGALQGRALRAPGTTHPGTKCAGGLEGGNPGVWQGHASRPSSGPGRDPSGKLPTTWALPAGCCSPRPLTEPSRARSHQGLAASPLPLPMPVSAEAAPSTTPVRGAQKHRGCCPGPGGHAGPGPFSSH